MEKTSLKYFLAANSCEGFYSAFDKSYIADGKWKTYIIKGGPGTGKSSFMKYFAIKAMDMGYNALLCPCTSDSSSLDAVILPDKKIVIMDGTAPHTVDPSFPAVCETILNFSDFWKKDTFDGVENKVIETTLYNKALHKTASSYIMAAGKLMSDNYNTALRATETEKVTQFAEKLYRKFVPKSNKGNVGTEWIRFIEGISPKGIISYGNTLLQEAKNRVIVEDEYGSASNIIMWKIRELALKNGYEIITLKNPFFPSKIIDHIIIPKLSIAFATENRYMHFNSDERRIHARRFVSVKKLHQNKERMKFNKKATKELLLSAAETLALAKSVHDNLEAFYIKAMDFDKLTAFAEKFTTEVLS